MFAWTSHGTELKRFTRQPITRAAIAVMLLIPLLYGAMYVWAFWDPTTRMDDLPVALVNNDIAAKNDDGKLEHYGQDVVKELLDNNDIGWALVDADTAEQGVNAGKYYFSVTIPSDFTTRINGLGGDDPTAASIFVTYDDTNSFLASRLGDTAMLEMQTAIREKVSKEAVDTLLVGVGDARKGFNTASDGAFTLADGLSDAASGAHRLNVGADDLAAGAKKLASCTVALSDGSTELHDNIKDYLVPGVKAARAGAEQLSSGAAKLSDLQDGLAQAADTSTGAPALASGVNQLVSGLTSYASGATSYAKGAASFSSGATSWASGAESWRAAASSATGGSLVTATTSIADGADSLSDATASSGSLSQGSAAVSAGNTKLASGLGDISDEIDAAEKLIDTDPDKAKALLADAKSNLASAKTSATSLASGADKVTSGIASVHSGAADLASGADQLKSGWATIHSALASDSTLGKALTTLGDGAGDLSTASTQLTAGAAQLSDPTTLAQAKALAAGATQLSSGITTMSAAASNTTTGIPALQSGLTQLVAGFNDPDPLKGLVAGADALNSGSEELAAGLKTGTSGAAELSSGATKLSSSVPELASGLDDATAGADKLGTKLSDGASEIPNDTHAQRVDRAEAVSTPVTITDQHVWKADSWGEGFAPFFIGLALWVGALITWLLLRPLQTRALMTSVNGFRMAWGSLNSALLLSVGQVGIMLAVMHFAIGLNPKNVVATILFTLLVGAAFFALQQFFQVTFGSAVGKVIIIVLLMVQLASAGGTYPIQTTPDFLQAINPYMPMTYVVNGLRETITGGMEARFWEAVAVMAGIFVVSLAATSIASARKRIWTMHRLHPALSI